MGYEGFHCSGCSAYAWAGGCEPVRTDSESGRHVDEDLACADLDGRHGYSRRGGRGRSVRPDALGGVGRVGLLGRRVVVMFGTREAADAGLDLVPFCNLCTELRYGTPRCCLMPLYDDVRGSMDYLEENELS